MSRGLKFGIDAGVQADAEADSTGKALVDLLGQIHVGITDLTTEVKRQYNAEQKRLTNVPINLPQSRLSTPAGATDLQDFGGPTPGREWIVRLLNAFAVPLAANAAVVTWYVGSIVPGPAAGMLPATMGVWQFSSVPGFQVFTSDVIRVRQGEHLIAGLTGVPAASAIALKAIVNDQPLYSGVQVR